MEAAEHLQGNRVSIDCMPVHTIEKRPLRELQFIPCSHLRRGQRASWLRVVRTRP